MENNHLVNQNGAVNENEVDSVMNRMDSERIDDIVENFDSFKQYLNSKVELGKKFGLDEEQLAKTAEKVGNYLSSHVEPKNREEKLLQELWKVGNEEQRHMLAHMLVRLVEQE